MTKNKMNELEEAIGTMYERISQKECDNCGELKQCFLHSKKSGKSFMWRVYN